jgi:hypothetical protein
MYYTKHALRRMKEFGVSKAEVAGTVIGYDTCVPARRGCANLWNDFGEYRIRVTLEPTRRLVVTVWKEIQ